jgi:hypothetical protein
MPISMLVVVWRQPEHATFFSAPCRRGSFFGSDTEKTLFEAELKFCIFTPKNIPPIREFRPFGISRGIYVLFRTDLPLPFIETKRYRCHNKKGFAFPAEIG